jgi:hypothetical protein
MLALWLRTALGQKTKYSLRANVFRFGPNNGHRSIGSACPFGRRAPKLTGDSRNGLETALIGDCRLFRPLAENQPQCLWGVLQHYLPRGDVHKLREAAPTERPSKAGAITLAATSTAPLGTA